MTDAQSIKSAIRKFVKSGETFDIVLATVTDVDTTNWLCSATPISGDNGKLINGQNSVAPLTNVQLTAQKTSNGVIPVPAIGSEVLILTTVRMDSYVVMCADVQEWLIYIDNGSGGYTQFSANSAGIQMNDGSYGGLVEVVNLVTKLNNLENKLNQLITVFATWTPVPNDGGAALKTALSSWISSSLTPTVRANIENTLIKHGI